MTFELACSSTAVQFWSDVRLPFEPRGEAKRARDELRRALKALATTGELASVYCSVDRGFCDVENVLLYNVGTSQFTELGSRRLCVTRSFQTPPISPSGRAYAHHHRYAAAPEPAADWRRGRLAGERTFAIPSPVRAATVWAAARTVAALTEDPSQSHEFGLDVVLALPATSPLGLASSMKRLLDGLVSSFHAHDGSGDVDLVAGRLAQQLGTHSIAALKQLLLQGPAVLGTRSLVRPFGDGVQWNPADDWLVTIDVQVTRGGTAPPRCLAKVYEVTERPALPERP